jgi:hypothetical protein
MNTKRLIIAAAMTAITILDGHKPFANTSNENVNVKQEQLVTVYPNPNRGSFNVKVANFTEGPEMVIYNMNSEHIVYQNKLSTDITQVNLNYLAKGVYIYRIYAPVDGSIVSTGKIEIE